VGVGKNMLHRMVSSQQRGFLVLLALIFISVTHVFVDRACKVDVLCWQMSRTPLESLEMQPATSCTGCRSLTACREFFSSLKTSPLWQWLNRWEWSNVVWSPSLVQVYHRHRHHICLIRVDGHNDTMCDTMCSPALTVMTGVCSAEKESLQLATEIRIW